MRNFNHVLSQSKSGKTVFLKIDIDDRFGKQSINYSSVTGWRSRLASKHLSFESEEWNDDVARNYVGLEALRGAKNQYEAHQFIEAVKALSRMEVHFWANKFLTNEKSVKAWRSFYL